MKLWAVRARLNEINSELSASFKNESEKGEIIQKDHEKIGLLKQIQAVMAQIKEFEQKISLIK
jgi:hypothetical protein